MMVNAQSKCRYQIRIRNAVKRKQNYKKRVNSEGCTLTRHVTSLTCVATSVDMLGTEQAVERRSDDEST